MKHLTDYINEQRMDEGLIRDVVMRTLDALFNGIGKLFDAGFKWASDSRDDIKGIFNGVASTSSNNLKRNKAALAKYNEYLKSQTKAKDYAETEKNALNEINRLSAENKSLEDNNKNETDESKRKETQNQIDMNNEVITQISVEQELLANETGNTLSDDMKTSIKDNTDEKKRTEIIREYSSRKKNSQVNKRRKQMMKRFK